MIDTSRISSEFDVELQLGSQWFFTALTELNEKGVLLPNGPAITVTSVQIVFTPGQDLEIGIFGLPTVHATLSLSDDGRTLVINTDLGFSTSIPFDAFDDLAEPPRMVKLQGNAEHEPVIAFLANLDIHGEPQSDEPLPDGEFEERGNPLNAQSFLPLGKHSVFGMGKASFPRFANDLWHASLRADDGSHPLPSEDDRKGSWTSVSITPRNNDIKIVLNGTVPIDSPVIDVLPDADVTITIIFKPVITDDGTLSFEINVDSDVDTGLLGDIFGFIVGGLIGFVIGVLTGGPLGGAIGAGIGAVSGIVIVEIAEVVVEGIVKKLAKAKIDGSNIPLLQCSKNDIVQVATSKNKSDIDFSLLKSIPSSIPIFTDRPDIIHERTLLVTSIYDDLAMNADGLGVTGTSGTAEKFQPLIASLIRGVYDQDELISLVYENAGGENLELPLTEIMSRLNETELQPPLRVKPVPDEDEDVEVSFRIPEGKLPAVCLTPSFIHREDTIITDIEFSTGLQLKVKDCIGLQDNAGVFVMEYQLIHPRDYNAYYRAKANPTTTDNLERLDRF